MQPLYFTKQIDGSFSIAEPQPTLAIISGLQETQATATELSLAKGSAVGGFAEEGYGLQQ